jgi:hypothetical protein
MIINKISECERQVIIKYEETQNLLEDSCAENMRLKVGECFLCLFMLHCISIS